MQQCYLGLPALDGLQLAQLGHAVAQGLEPLEQRDGLVDGHGDLAGVHAGQVVRPVERRPRARAVAARLALGLPQRRLLLQHHARKTLRGSAEDLCNAAIKQAVLAKCSFRTSSRVKSPTALDSGVQELEIVPRCNHCIARGLITSALKVLSNKLSAQQSAKPPAAGQPGQLAQPQWALEECPRATAGQQTAPEA